MANRAEHFHQEAVLAHIGEGKEDGKGEELSKFLTHVLLGSGQANTAGSGALPSFLRKNRATSCPKSLWFFF